MPDPTDAPAASSAAPLASLSASAPDALETLTAPQLHDWRMTGKLPDPNAPPAAPADPPTPDVDAASSAATVDADSPAPTGASSEPGSDPAYKEKTAKRISELLERADRAERRAQALEARAPAQTPPPETRPAAPSAAPASGLVRPNPDDFAYGTVDEGYLEALTDYKVAATLETERTRVAHADREARAQDQQRQAIDAFNARADKARAKHPDFDATAMLAPTEIPQGSPVDLLILEDEHGAEILYHLQQPEHTAERRQILAMKPLDQLKALVRLGDTLAAAPAARSTTAPPPPPTLATRATPGDAVERALAQSGDEGTRAYIDAANKRELARLKR